MPLPTRPPFLRAAAVAFALLLGTAALAGDSPIEPPTPTVIPANEEEKTGYVAAVEAAAQAKDPEKLAAAVAQMQERRHDAFVPVIRRYVDSDDPKVQAAAITAAASHELKDLEKTVRKILKSKPKKQGGPPALGVVATACVDYLARLGFAGEEEFVLKEQLTALIADERRIKASWSRELVRAALHYLGKNKFKPAVPFLIEEMLPTPTPADPNDPKNPPASYWEARTKLWHEHESWTRWALKEITGQEFRSVREWQAWLKQQDKKAFK